MCVAAGFLAAAGAEIAGSGTFLAQLGKAPLPIVLILALVTAASIVPVVKVGAECTHACRLEQQQQQQLPSHELRGCRHSTGGCHVARGMCTIANNISTEHVQSSTGSSSRPCSNLRRCFACHSVLQHCDAQECKVWCSSQVAPAAVLRQ
jgi:hypothetical protein